MGIDTGNPRMTRELLEGEPTYKSVCEMQLQILTYNTRHDLIKGAYVCELHIGKGMYST